MAGNKAVFLDRDGTINKDRHYLYKISDFEYLDGAVEGLRALSDMGYMLVVITNQSGIARGYYTEDDYKQLNQWMCMDLLGKGIQIAGSYHCPHLPNGSVVKYAKECDCRKPRTGLFWKAASELDIDMNNSLAIGDKMRDLAICEESGVKGILLSDAEKPDCGYEVCADWSEIIHKIQLIQKQESRWQR